MRTSSPCDISHDKVLRATAWVSKESHLFSIPKQNNHIQIVSKALISAIKKCHQCDDSRPSTTALG
jgi:hypothetical protein